MTEITASWHINAGTGQRDIVSVEFLGHAGFDPGNDIVCASVSILANLLESAIRDQARLSCTVETDATLGFWRISWAPDAAGHATFVAESVCRVCRMLSMDYPDNVSFFEEQEDTDEETV